LRWHNWLAFASDERKKCYAWDWPAEVNYHEAKAFVMENLRNWTTESAFATEDEWHRALLASWR